MNLTAEQQDAIAARVNSMTLRRGMGDEYGACSIAAINLALTGRLTDEVPDCMSEVIGQWIIRVQDAMPDEMRNSKAWKSLLPLAAGTGRDREHERQTIVLEWMWTVVLPYVQPIADAGGYGKKWRDMCEKRTRQAADKAARVAWAAEAAKAAKAAQAVRAVEATRAAWAAEAAAWAAEASGDPDAAWKHFDPCALLEKLIEVGK